MKTPPSNLTEDAIRSALSDQWNLDVVALTYAPLGFGSHHWIAEIGDGDKRFVTVDELSSAYLGETKEESFHILATAFQVAASLRDDANLAFVNAPIVDRTGRWLIRLDDNYSIAVFPFLDVEPTEFDLFPHEDDLFDAIRVVGEIHAATPLIAVEALPEESFVLPKRTELLQALSELDIPWSGGPYSEPARRLLSNYASVLQERLDHFNRVVAEVLTDTSGWVITHGEPHAGNIIRTRSGSMAVVDWAAVSYAPPERDLWMLLDEEHSGFSTYTEATNTTSLSELALTAYRLHWNLSDIAVFVSWIRSPHDQSEEMEMTWSELEAYVKEVTFNLCRAG